MIEKLEKVRELKSQIVDMKEEYNRILPTIASPSLNGMPKGHAKKTDRWIDERRILEDRIKRTEKERKALESEIIPFIETMKQELYKFCLYYFIGAGDVVDVCDIMHISRRTFYNRLADVVHVCNESLHADAH